MLFRSTAQGMKRIDISGKNSLPIGQVLHLNGYNEPDYIIVKNLGINPKFGYNGATYLVINLDDLLQHRKDASDLKFINEKQDNRIQTYITDEVKSSDFVLDLWEKPEAKRLKMQASQNQLKAENDALEAKGKKLFAKHIPENAKALIIACYDVDDSDSQTDYFAHTTGGTVILGYSTHTRDIFSEMRKHAGKIPETKHLATPPDVNGNGQPKTEENKEYWSPSDEHREKYSMGSGYYLKDRYNHSSGWRVKKICKWRGDWGREIYIAMAKRCIF